LTRANFSLGAPPPSISNLSRFRTLTEICGGESYGEVQAPALVRNAVTDLEQSLTPRHQWVFVNVWWELQGFSGGRFTYLVYEETLQPILSWIRVLFIIGVAI
jgi:hypothetical protein